MPRNHRLLDSEQLSVGFKTSWSTITNRKWVQKIFTDMSGENKNVCFLVVHIEMFSFTNSLGKSGFKIRFCVHKG